MNVFKSSNNHNNHKHSIAERKKAVLRHRIGRRKVQEQTAADKCIEFIEAYAIRVCSEYKLVARDSHSFAHSRNEHVDHVPIFDPISLMQYLSFGLSSVTDEEVHRVCENTTTDETIAYIEDTMRELRDLLTIWKSCHAYGDMWLTLDVDSQGLVVDTKRKQEAIQRCCLDDMIACYYQGVPASDLAA